MNPMTIFKLKSKLENFKKNHPKVPMFFKAISGEIKLDSIIEVKLTTAEGKVMVTNFRVTQDDLDLFDEIKSQMRQ